MIKKNFQPAGLELLILQVLWDRGPSTVREVLDRLQDGKVRAYTTVLSTMQVMERKNFLRRDGSVSGAIVYSPAVAREDVTGSALRDFLASMFGGKPLAVVQHLLDEQMLDAQELAEIRLLLDEHQRTSPNPDSDAGGSRKKKPTEKPQGNR